MAMTADGTLLVGDTISGGLVRDWVSFQRNFPKHVPLSPAVVRRIVVGSNRSTMTGYTLWAATRSTTPRTSCDGQPRPTSVGPVGNSTT